MSSDFKAGNETTSRLTFRLFGAFLLGYFIVSGAIFLGRIKLQPLRSLRFQLHFNIDHKQVGELYRDERTGSSLSTASDDEIARSIVPQAQIVGVEESFPKDNEDFVTQKLEAAMNCYRQCKSNDAEVMKTKLITNFETLREHYENLLARTEIFRPNFRHKSAVYKDYLGPRMEDHFIHNLISVPFEKSTFFPLVPLFVHWTEVQFGNAGGGIKSLTNFLVHNLRRDVVYFTVTSCYSRRFQEVFIKKGIKVLFASSKGDLDAHIILPHLFYFNNPAFDPTSGREIFTNITFKGNGVDYSYPNEKTTEAERIADLHLASDEQRRLMSWNFRKYKSFEQLPKLDMDDNDRSQLKSLIQETNGNLTTLFPREYIMSFIGSLSTHKGRRDLIPFLEEKYRSEPEKFLFKMFPVDQKCLDFSAATDVSFCWRVFMLASKYALAPVGTAPTSYRLYEALQMGVIPIYLHDERGPFLPYKGTKADIATIGYVADFNNARELLEGIIHEFDKYPEIAEQKVLNSRKVIASVRESHFTPRGVARQVEKWLFKPQDESFSDLRCCSNPAPYLLSDKQYDDV